MLGLNKGSTEPSDCNLAMPAGRFNPTTRPKLPTRSQLPSPKRSMSRTNPAWASSTFGLASTGTGRGCAVAKGAIHSAPSANQSSRARAKARCMAGKNQRALNWGRTSWVRVFDSIAKGASVDQHPKCGTFPPSCAGSTLGMSGSASETLNQFRVFPDV